MSVARDPSDRSRARKRMQRTRIITIFDRYNVFKSCRETTTILYAGARMFIIRDTFVIRTFESLLLNHWRTNLFRYLYKRKKRNKEMRALVVLSCGSSGRNREQKKCLIGNNSSRVKESCVYLCEERNGRAFGSKRRGERKVWFKNTDIKDTDACVNPCSPYVLTALAYIATPLHCDHVYKENSLKARR